MKPVFFWLAGALLAGCTAALAQRASDKPGPQGKWKLVWSDEFNTDGRPDPQNWTYEIGFVRNEEFQWYQPANATVKNGMLVIEARREQKKNPNYKAGSKDWETNREYAEYTSASLTTQNRLAWKYGRFEMRARIDTRSGLWPAFWTLGITGEWPHGGEIDIMEYYHGTVNANAAWGNKEKWVPIWDSTFTPLEKLGGKDWSKKFHVWRMDWDANSITLSVDGRVLNTTDVTQTFNKDAEGRNPFRQPHYLLLNLAVGGMNGGDPSGTTFPAKFEVDYVRVYEWQEQRKRMKDEG